MEGKANEELRAKLQAGAEPLLEQGETVQLGVGGAPIPLWACLAGMLLLFIPGLVLMYVNAYRGKLVLLTDRNIYVMASPFGGLRSGKSKEVLAKYPIASVDVAVGPAVLGTRQLVVGERKMYVGTAGEEPERIADATRAQSSS